MKRRDILAGIGAGAVAAGLGACARESAGPAVHTGGERLRWKMVTTWPPNYPGLGTGAQFLADFVKRMSAGRLEIKVYGAGELVPAFEVFDAVSGGTAEMGHAAPYYWKGKSPATQFFSAVPFGMAAREMNAWLYFEGGIDLWTALYAPFNLVPMPAGNTGVQMGGWFKREINSLADLEGLTVRVPGLGAEVLRRAGATPVTMPGNEIFTSLQTGRVEAAEWVGPYNDLAFGLHTIARYYYYPGWQEPGSTLECIVNKEKFDALPADLQEIVRCACRATNENMFAEYTARNQRALSELVNEHGVQLRAFPDDVMQRLKALSGEVLEEIAADDQDARRIYDSYRAFQATVRSWSDVSERAYLNVR